MKRLTILLFGLLLSLRAVAGIPYVVNSGGSATNITLYGLIATTGNAPGSYWQIGGANGLTNRVVSLSGSNDLRVQQYTNGAWVDCFGVTNGQTFAVGSFAANLAGSTNYYATNLVGRAYHVTNVTANVSVPDASKQGSQHLVLLSGTNIAGFANLITGIQAQFSVCYSNSTGSTVIITNPPTSTPIGGVTTNQMNLLAGKQGYWSFDVLVGVWTNYCNAQ